MNRKRGTSSRTMRTVTIDAALDARMRKIKKFNWSAIAANAFQRALADQHCLADINKVIARLRRSRDTADEQYAAGEQAGRLWAAENASFHELRRLAAFVIHNGPAAWQQLEEGAVNLPAEISGNRDAAAEAFWNKAGGAAALPEQPAWRVGFVEGAFSLWKAVVDQL